MHVRVYVRACMDVCVYQYAHVFSVSVGVWYTKVIAYTVHTYVHTCGLFSLSLNRIDESMCEEDSFLPKEGIMEPSGQYMPTCKPYRASCLCCVCKSMSLI